MPWRTIALTNNNMYDVQFGAYVYNIKHTLIIQNPDIKITSQSKFKLRLVKMNLNGMTTSTDIMMNEFIMVHAVGDKLHIIDGTITIDQDALLYVKFRIDNRIAMANNTIFTLILDVLDVSSSNVYYT